jgi:hypothetical protein
MRLASGAQGYLEVWTSNDDTAMRKKIRIAKKILDDNIVTK